MTIKEAIKQLEKHDPDTPCAMVVWLPNDLECETEQFKLTDEEIAETLHYIQKSHDASVGINWSTLAQAAEHIVEKRDEHPTSTECTHTESMPELDAKMVTVTFHPQAWVNHFAVPVDPEGPTKWQVSKDNLRDFEPDSEESDELKNHSAAPQWVKDWTGPFFIDWEN